MALLGRSYVIVVAKPHAVPQAAELAGNGSGKFLWRLSRLPRRALDLLPVFVRPGKKPGLKAQGSLAPRDGVGHQRGVRVTDVRPGIHIIDRGSDVKAGGIGHEVGSS